MRLLEQTTTRPLFMLSNPGSYKFFYTFDGNKNVSELVHFETRNGIAAHYDYAPFGAITRAISASAVTDNTFTTDNPFRFSSEYHDDTLGLVYYNYRHYNPVDGRWCGRDLAEASFNLYSFSNNFPFECDFIGLFSVSKNNDGDSKGRRFKGHITGTGWAVDWNLTWGWSIEGAINIKDCCISTGVGVSMGGDVGVTFGYSKTFNAFGGNVFLLGGIRGYTSLQASTKVKLPTLCCGTNGIEVGNEFGFEISSKGRIGVEGGILARYWRDDIFYTKKKSPIKETGIGVRGYIDIGVTFSVDCISEECSVTRVLLLQDAKVEWFTAFLGFEYSSELWEKDNFAWSYKETAQFENPFLELLKGR